MRGNLFASSVLLNPFGVLEDEWNKKKNQTAGSMLANKY